MARATGVGDLVVIVSSLSQRRMSHEVLTGVGALVDRRYLTTGCPVPERRVSLHGEAVQGDMFGVERQCSMQVRPPIPLVGGRQTEDQVEGKFPDTGATDRLDRFIDLIA